MAKRRIKHRRKLQREEWRKSAVIPNCILIPGDGFILVDAIIEAFPLGKDLNRYLQALIDGLA